MKTYSVIAASVALSCSLISLTHADSIDGVPAVAVHFGDLDLASPAGDSALYNRISVAAQSVCRPLEPGKRLERITPYKVCLQQAMSKAVARINRPVFTDYVATKMDLPVSAGIKLAAR